MDSILNINSYDIGGMIGGFGFDFDYDVERSSVRDDLSK